MRPTSRPSARSRRRFERHPRPVRLDEDPRTAERRGRRPGSTGRGGSPDRSETPGRGRAQSSRDLRQERARGVEAPERPHSVPAEVLSRHERDARRREDPLPERSIGLAERERLVGKDEKLRARAPRAAPRPSSARARSPPERRSHLRTSRGDRRCRSPPRRPSRAPSRSGRRTGPAGPPGLRRASPRRPAPSLPPRPRFPSAHPGAGAAAERPRHASGGSRRPDAASRARRRRRRGSPLHCRRRGPAPATRSRSRSGFFVPPTRGIALERLAGVDAVARHPREARAEAERDQALGDRRTERDDPHQAAGFFLPSSPSRTSFEPFFTSSWRESPCASIVTIRGKSFTS